MNTIKYLNYIYAVYSRFNTLSTYKHTYFSYFYSYIQMSYKFTCMSHLHPTTFIVLHTYMLTYKNLECIPYHFSANENKSLSLKKLFQIISFYVALAIKFISIIFTIEKILSPNLKKKYEVGT